MLPETNEAFWVQLYVAGMPVVFILVFIWQLVSIPFEQRTANRLANYFMNAISAAIIWLPGFSLALVLAVPAIIFGVAEHYYSKWHTKETNRRLLERQNQVQ